VSESSDRTPSSDKPAQAAPAVAVREDLPASSGAPAPVGAALARGGETSRSRLAAALDTGAGRNVGLLAVLGLLIVIGIWTAGADRFATIPNTLNILQLASIIAVVSVGMTFVIIGGGIDLSVGAIVALASVWCTTVATQTTAENSSFLAMAAVALAVGTACGAINGILVAYGRIVPFIMTLAMLAGARGLAERISNRQSQLVTVRPFVDFFNARPISIGEFAPSMAVYIFILVAVVGWVVLNRTTFGRRTFAVGGNIEAARLAGIDVRRHTAYLYTLLGFCCGIAAIMITARTTTGTSTHGLLYELDAIAAVVIGGTLLSGGRGTIVGSMLGVLVFTVLTNIFSLNNLTTATQAIAKGVIIVLAVLLQQRVGRSSAAP
jgi:ribose transport system permease protein